MFINKLKRGKSKNNKIEWIKCGLPWLTYNNTENFCSSGLNKPGTLVKVDNHGKQEIYLIGTMNEVAGICDDCSAFAESCIVIEYFRIELPIIELTRVNGTWI